MASSLDLSLDRRLAGVLIPVFALREQNDLGIGDVGSLRRFIDWAASGGFGVVQLLPINETGGDNSPYNAISSMALDPTTLELQPGVPPELTEAAFLAATANSASRGARVATTVDYAFVKPLKLRLLQEAFDVFTQKQLGTKGGRGKRVAEFQRFQTDNRGWLEGYTLFRSLMEANGNTECWDRWPTEQQTMAAAISWLTAQPLEARAQIEQRRAFFAYVQWLAYGQWEDLKKYSETRGVALMGDIPLGISYYSADYFAAPQIFEQGWSGGAPPEPYFKDDPFTQKWGQNWGIPVYNWEKMREDNFAWWRQRVHGVRDLFHLFRIDHILGFYRIYSFPWRPERNGEFLPLSPDEAKALTGGVLPQFKRRGDDSPEDREANRQDGDFLLRMVLDAAGDTRLIGEDLGTVPDYVRPNLTALGIAGFKIPIWEPDKSSGGLLAGSEYNRLSVATYGTHDHEPLKAFWQRQLQSEPSERADLLHLADFAGIPADDRGTYNSSIHKRLLAALFRTNSWIVICMITDLLGGEERFNVPGTSANSNWSQRMQMTVETLVSDPGHANWSAGVRELIGASGRAMP